MTDRPSAATPEGITPENMLLDKWWADCGGLSSYGAPVVGGPNRTELLDLIRRAQAAQRETSAAAVQSLDASNSEWARYMRAKAVEAIRGGA